MEPTAKRGERRPRTGWELRELIRPLPARRCRQPEEPRPRFFDPALVEYVYQSRFVIPSQLERRFPQWLSSSRTSQRHIARLIDAKYLATASVRSTGPNFPTVLYATGRGVRLVKETYAAYGQQWNGAVTEERKAKGLALDSILHELLVSELDLAVYREVESRDDLVLLDRERRYFRRDRELAYWQQGRARRIVPDAGYLPAVQTGAARRWLPLHLVELENGTHTVAKLRRKLEAYQQWAATAADGYLHRVYRRFGEPQHRPTFRLLLIAHDKYGTVPDERRLLDLLVQAIELPRAMREAIWLTTAEQLRRHQDDATPLNAPIWYRARDARPWLPEYRRLVNRLPQSAEQKGYTQQREFVAHKAGQLPMHALFPRPE